MDDALVQVLLNQHCARNHVEESFSPLAYRDIIKELNWYESQQQKNYDVQSCKKRKMFNDEEFDFLEGVLVNVGVAVAVVAAIRRCLGLIFILRNTSLASWLLLRLIVRL
ncbi:hypothetical protein M9H77_03810 [Catharanthus roseus]|uniref:Uncharacterized protein n=1 Tax=Catharanthus roseus TaxID=4058 RepID=A0ACC0CCA1_CATRO|nr:hypothetical protein M9H77_03810 [Catharanthus roseus]